MGSLRSRKGARALKFATKENTGGQKSTRDQVSVMAEGEASADHGMKGKV